MRNSRTILYNDNIIILCYIPWMQNFSLWNLCSNGSFTISRDVLLGYPHSLIPLEVLSLEHTLATRFFSISLHFRFNRRNKLLNREIVLKMCCELLSYDDKKRRQKRVICFSWFEKFSSLFHYLQMFWRTFLFCPLFRSMGIFINWLETTKPNNHILLILQLKWSFDFIIIFCCEIWELR